MELRILQQLADGVTTLAELEAAHPTLGQKLEKFVRTIDSSAKEAYNRFSDCLDSVLRLSNRPTKAEKDAVFEKLQSASDSKWFRDIAGICDDLGALAEQYGDDLRSIATAPENANSPKASSIWNLLGILNKHEQALKYEIRFQVDYLKIDIASSNIEQARNRAISIKREIGENLSRISVVSRHIAGSSSKGAERLLERREIARLALSAPERIFVFGSAYMVLVLIIGTTIFQALSIFQFIVLSAFVLASSVVINAVYLSNLDKLSEASFIELVKLSLINFFLPIVSLMRRNAQARPDDTNHKGPGEADRKSANVKSRSGGA